MTDNKFSGWEPEIFESLIHSMSLCMAVYAVDKKYYFGNDAFNSLIKGDPYQSLINPSFEKIIHFEHTSALIFTGFVTIGSVNDINTSIFANIYRKEDQILIIGGTDILSLTEQNKILHQMNAEIVKLQRDLLHKTHLQEKTLTELHLTNEELKKINTDKDNFVKILAHDLKNPMFSISGFTDLLLKNFKKYDDDTIEKQLSIINSTSKKTFGLLEELLLWSKSQSGKIQFEPGCVSFKTICNEIISLLKESAQSKQIQIEYNDFSDLKLYADVNMLRTVLRNLISNAIKFTNENGKITINTKNNQSYATITVTDNGTGISPNDMEKLWKINELHTTPGTKGEKGSGFGLLLCKEFVEKHNGKIWVESEYGKGSNFNFTIPLESWENGSANSK